MTRSLAFLSCLFLSLSLSAGAGAVEVAGVNLEPSVLVNGKSLVLNGHGIRKKFFFKVYVGALYTSERVSTPSQLLNNRGDKLVRMHFLHSKVEKEKIIDAFAEGFRNNSPEMAGSDDARTFLSLFKADFIKGDVVDLVLGADGTVSARHNGRILGSVRSARLPDAILLIYVGPKPADDDLKRGFFGRH